MQRRSFVPLTFTWCMALGMGAVLVFGPDAITERLQTGLADGSRLGLSLLTRLQVPLIRCPAPGRPALQGEIRSLRCRNLALQHRVAQLEEELARQTEFASFPLHETFSPPLIKNEFVAATVLGEAGRKHLLNLGRTAGLNGDELVLDGEGQLIDQGDAAGIDPDQLVTDGHSIAGRIHRVGRWTSTVQPLTDPGFRAAARLVRRSPSGPVFGGRGVLVGAGKSCRLENVAASEAVNVGDAVYSDDPLVSQPLVFGYVSHALLGPADPFWTIEVTPAVARRLDSVVVVTSRFNPDRLTDGGGERQASGTGR